MPLGDPKHVGGAMPLDGMNRSIPIGGGFRTEDATGDLVNGVPVDSISNIGAAGNLVSPMQLTSVPIQLWIPYGAAQIIMIAEGECAISGGLTATPSAPGTLPAFVSPVAVGSNATPPGGGWFPIPNRTPAGSLGTGARELPMTLDLAGMNAFWVRARGNFAQLYFMFKMMGQITVN